jgi:hypothetical protein
MGSLEKLANGERANLVAGIADLSFPGACGAFAKTSGFTGAVTEVEEFGAADASVALDFYGGYLRGIGGERTFNAFALDDAAHGEHFTSSRTTAGDHDAAELLDAFFGAFENSSVDVDGVADGELEWLFAEAGFFSRFQEFLTHGRSP